MGEAAIAAARAINYVGAGTVEFIADKDAFYFIEMNTRLQVEHPVTEAITGLDLVEWQLRVAAAEPLPLGQKDLEQRGHAVEARLYAESPQRGFLPQTGTLHGLLLPEAEIARVDTGVRLGDTVSQFYDPMIAKIIAWGENRTTALGRLRRALAETAVSGISTNLDFLARLTGHPEFASGRIDTGFIERHRSALIPDPRPAPDIALATAALVRLRARQAAAQRTARHSGDLFSPWAQTDGWRLNGRSHQAIVLHDGLRQRSISASKRAEKWLLEFDGQTRYCDGGPRPNGGFEIDFDDVHKRLIVLDHGAETTVFLDGESWRLVDIDPLGVHEGDDPGGGRLTAPMPGRVAELMVAIGQNVRRGEPLMTIEAMKMEHTLRAPADGIVAAVHFAVGESVEEGAELITVIVPDDGGRS
jgi:3-methylcrotonyl-CoA carboxylase alpha subunit